MINILHFYLPGFQWTIIKEHDKELKTVTLINVKLKNV